MYFEFKRLTDDYAEDADFSKILYNPNQLTHVYASCRPDMLITVHPKTGTSFLYAQDTTYSVQALESRCNDKFHSDEDHSPPEVALPVDYSLHATRGISLLMNYLSTNLFALSETFGAEENIVEGPIDMKRFWVLDETVESEGSDAVYFIKGMVHDRLVAQISNADLASVATYVVGLVYSLFLAFWVFRPLLRNYAAEIRHNRACKFFYFTF
jgi:hypothetical protein